MAGCLSKPSIVILLLCSQIGSDLESNKTKPLTARQWAELSGKLSCSPMKSPEAFLNTSVEDWIANLNIGLDEAQRIKALLSRTALLEKELEQMQRMGLNLTTIAEGSYPEKLKVRLGTESPPVLYYSGSLDMLQITTVAVFGSAYWDKASRNFAKVLADNCAKQGLVIISGGGFAVESIIEQRVLQRNGKAAYFLSYGYMEKLNQEKIQSAISSGSLVLLSAVHPGAPLTLRSSIDKSKYIYGLADYAVVVSAENRNGLIYNGAVENLKRHSIPLFVGKGTDMPEGNAALIEQGGKPLTVDAIPVFVDGISSNML